jgi:hypothetical protein
VVNLAEERAAGDQRRSGTMAGARKDLQEPRQECVEGFAASIVYVFDAQSECEARAVA